MRLIAIARDEGIRRIVGSILPENLGMPGSARNWASACRTTLRTR